VIYEYLCEVCGSHFDVVKPVSEYNTPEACRSCNYDATRVPFPRKIYLHGTAVQEKKWNPALGCAVTDSEAKKIAKERGLIEVGNEDPSKHLKPKELNLDDVWQGA
jgi:putative FmdB family regulatory protein